MKTLSVTPPIALANSFDPDQTRASAGHFSAALSDAASAAHAASATAHTEGTPAAHGRAAKLHRTAAARALAEDNNAQHATHEGIAKGHDAMSGPPNEGCAPGGQTGIETVGGKIGQSALDNAALVERDGEGFRMALENDSPGIDDEGWALIAPFGEHRKTRLYRENGLAKEQKFVQVLDNESADTMLAKENSFFRSLKRALIGIPVYKGHGDLNDADPKAIANETQKIKLGVVDKIRKAARGIEAHFALDNDGAEAVAAGWKLPSAFWWVLPISNDGDTIRCRPFKLISVALTQFPNISGVESLANATERRSQTATTAEQKQLTQEPEMKMIAGWLLAQGIALANSEAPTESQVLEAFQKLHTAKAGEVVALGNEKSTLAGKITALENDVATQTKLATDNATALANEQTARKAERRHAAEAVADLAIQRGKKTVADRAALITALENSTTFAADSQALLAGKAVVKTGAEAVSGKQSAALSNEAQQAQVEYQQAFQTELVATGQNPVQAHRNIMTLPKYSGLAAKFVPAPAQ